VTSNNARSALGGEVAVDLANVLGFLVAILVDLPLTVVQRQSVDLAQSLIALFAKRLDGTLLDCGVQCGPGLRLDGIIAQRLLVEERYAAVFGLLFVVIGAGLEQTGVRNSEYRSEQFFT
jgi:hypothetical protein